MLVDNNHTWKDIQTYTLAEIGCFVSEIRERIAMKDIEEFSTSWLANNMDGKAYSKHIKTMYRRYGIDEPKPNPKDVDDDWEALKDLSKKQVPFK